MTILVSLLQKFCNKQSFFWMIQFKRRSKCGNLAVKRNEFSKLKDFHIFFLQKEKSNYFSHYQDCCFNLSNSFQEKELSQRHAKSRRGTFLITNFWQIIIAILCNQIKQEFSSTFRSNVRGKLNLPKRIAMVKHYDLAFLLLPFFCKI